MNTISAIRNFVLLALTFFAIFENILANSSDSSKGDNFTDAENLEDDEYNSHNDENRCLRALRNIAKFNVEGTSAEAFYHYYLLWSNEKIRGLSNFNDENLQKSINIIVPYVNKLYTAIISNHNRIDKRIRSPDNWCNKKRIIHMLTDEQYYVCISELSVFGDSKVTALLYGFQNMTIDHESTNEFVPKYYLDIGRKFKSHPRYFVHVPSPRKYCDDYTSDSDDGTNEVGDDGDYNSDGYDDSDVNRTAAEYASDDDSLNIIL